MGIWYSRERKGGKGMPVKVIKVRGGYKVRTPGRVHAKKTSKGKAEAQRRLLNAVEHGWRPTGRSKRKKK